MLGGYQILDLRGIDLTIGTSASNITDAKVLSQLRELRNHIQKDYNFAKPLNNQLKPVLIRYRDKKNGEKHEVAIYGNLEVLTNYYTFLINAIGHGEKLSVEVVFEEKTDEYGNKYWDIKTAKVLLESAKNVLSNLLADGDIENAKPIYCHPITIRNGDIGMTLTCLIFNNDDTPFTLATFKDWIDTVFEELPSDVTLRIMSSGYYKSTDGTKIGIASYIYKYHGTPNLYGIFGGNVADASAVDVNNSTFDTVFPSGTLLYDGVNKIN